MLFAEVICPQAPLCCDFLEVQSLQALRATGTATIEDCVTMPRLDDFIGQAVLKDLIRPKIELALASGIALPHLLLCGDKELGKTAFAAAIADELQVPITSVSASSLATFLDLRDILLNVRKHQIFTISDVDTLRPLVLNVVIAALSDFRIDITVGVGADARKHSLPMPRFSFVGTTSKPWLVDERLRRWCIICKFGPYTEVEAAQIVLRIAREKGILLDLDAASEIASQCRHIPGEAAVFLQRVASHFPLDPSDQLDRSKLRQINEFLGAGNLYPDLLTIGDQLQTMEGAEFEQWVAALFTKAGFHVEITPVSGDHGVDLWASISGCMVAVQCKRWNGSIGEPVLRDLYGAMMAAKVQFGCLVTTGSFTAQAFQFAKNKPLHLVGFDLLMEAAKSPYTLPYLLNFR
jgi:Holliday junction resolvasome RuvABC ATP-dependent DNA helicase subunit